MRIVLSLVVALLLPVHVLAQTTWYVDGAGIPPGAGTPASPYTGVQIALSAQTTLPGDTIMVLPGIYFEDVDFLGKDVTLRSTDGAAVTTLRGTGATAVVIFQSGESELAVLDGFTITEGRGVPGAMPTGGGVFCSASSPTLRNLVVRENRAMLGYGMAFVDDSAAKISHSIVEQNAGACWCGGMKGGGIYSTGSIEVRNSTIRSNGGTFHPVWGGGIWGSGLYVDCEISQNHGFYGGGAYAAGALQFIRCSFTDNSAHSFEQFDGPFEGGAVYGGTLTDCVLTGNAAVWRGGGAAYAILNGCLLEENSALMSDGFNLASGGGAYSSHLSDCIVRGNVSNASSTGYPASGGGLQGGSATRCLIEDNRVNAGAGWPPWILFGGGGASDVALNECEVIGNQVIAPSGGVYTGGGGGAFGGSAVRTSFVDNMAPKGGGVFGTALTHCTLVGNVADIAGAIYSYSAATDVSNSIAWSNGPSPIATDGGGAVNLTYSTIEGGYPGPGNLAGDPGFLSIEHRVLRLRPDSACIDAGDPSSPNDPDGSRADMGVFPFECGTAHSYGSSKLNSQGCTPLLSSEGLASLSGPGHLTVHGANFLNRKAGVLFWGRGSANAPFGGHIRYVSAPLVRTATQDSGGTPPPYLDCTGTYAFHFTPAYMTTAGMNAGDVIYCQWFSRDVQSTFGMSLSNALVFTICP